MSVSTYKIVLLGVAAVGKTSVITRFVSKHYDANYLPTIGLDYFFKTVYLEDATVRLQIWDSAGMERFASLLPRYVRECSVAVIIYDITSISSFEKTNEIIENVRRERGNDVNFVLVGNKSDLESQRVVSYEMGREKADSIDALFIETSAKMGYNVRVLFRKIATALESQQHSLDKEEDDGTPRIQHHIASHEEPVCSC
ncbi:hypothetical protein PCE1_004704 [Barthelona sp. PCE]